MVPMPIIAMGMARRRRIAFHMKVASSAYIAVRDGRAMVSWRGRSGAETRWPQMDGGMYRREIWDGLESCWKKRLVEKKD